MTHSRRVGNPKPPETWSRSAEPHSRSGWGRVYVFSVAQTFLSAVSQGFQACNRFVFPHEARDWSEPADKNVGDTADRNVCATNPGLCCEGFCTICCGPGRPALRPMPLLTHN
jgi:hypothetical protein